MQGSEGIAINWTMGTGRANIKLHPLYIKYNNQQMVSINLLELKTDLGAIIYTEETQYVAAYLANLLRVVTLIQ